MTMMVCTPNLFNLFKNLESKLHNVLTNLDTLRHEMKRQGLVPFPRVGRGGMKNQASYWAKLYNQDTGKRAESGAMSGMWFGPRLGRVQKREATGDKENPQH